MVQRRNLIEVDFAYPSLLATQPPRTHYTLAEITRSSAPLHIKARFRDTHGEVTAFVRKWHNAEERSTKLREQYVAAVGWRKLAAQWQLRLSVCAPTPKQVAQFAAEQLDTSIAALHTVAIKMPGDGFCIAQSEELSNLVEIAWRATHVHIFVCQPGSPLAKAPRLIQHLR